MALCSCLHFKHTLRACAVCGARLFYALVGSCLDASSQLWALSGEAWKCPELHRWVQLPERAQTSKATLGSLKLR
eukprot:2035219-Alexandrium_andersonii.AAC.1